MDDNFQTNLDKYAEIAIKVGLNLQPGQSLMVDALLESAPLVRLAAKHAYLCGARLVDVFWIDEELTRTRFQFAPPDSFDRVAEGYVYAANQYAERRDAYLAISGRDPDLLSGQDPARVAMAQKTLVEKLKPCVDLEMANAFNWLVLACANPRWAERVFPDLPPTGQVEKLWDAIFAACRVYEPDPVAAWQAHLEALDARARVLNERRYSALHFVGTGTDLTVGLADEHLWVGGIAQTERGISFVANMPTEEIFTAPHRKRVDGVVSCTMPVSVRGCLVENLRLTFQDGRVTRADASSCETILKDFIDTDDGAGYLGEVALVPQNNPIAQREILFYNGLFDENAASHLALGKAYPNTLRDGEHLSPEELAARGANDSLTHLDMMIGSAEMDVDGLTPDGRREPLMRAGGWCL